MTANQYVRAFAGTFVLVSLLLAHATGQVNFFQAQWLWFTAFVGANLLQSAFSGFCPLETILRRLGLTRPEGA